MSSHLLERPPEYILKSAAILNCIASGKRQIRDIADATAFAQTTVIRIAALLVGDHVLDARRVGSEIELFIRVRGASGSEE